MEFPPRKSPSFAFPHFHFRQVNKSCRFQHLSHCQISLYILNCFSVFSFLTWNLAVGLRTWFSSLYFLLSSELFCRKISYYGIQPSCLVFSPTTPLPAFYSSQSELNAALRTCPVLISTECFPLTGLPFPVVFLILPLGLLLTLAHSSRLRLSVLKNVIL